jgi:hypothetical protein
VIDSLFDQNFLSSRINWFSKILSLLTVDSNMPQLGITRAEGFYKYLKNYNADPSSDGLCYTFDPALLSNDVTALVPYTPQGINHAELTPVYFIFPGSHTSTMFADAMTLANPMDTTPYNAQASVYAVADAVLHYVTANEAFLTGRDVYFVGFSLGGLRAIYTLYALQTYNPTIASRTHCISFNPWIGKFGDGDLLGLATWLGVNNADDQLDPWHLARLTELRTQTGLPIHSVIERTLVLCIRDESASRLWQSENNATPPQRIGWGRLYLYPNAQPAATDPTVAHSILNWAGNAFPDVVPDIRVVKHGTFALSTQTMFMGKAGVDEPTLLTVTSEAQHGYKGGISQFAVHSFWRTPGLTSNQYLWTIVPINSAGLLRFVNKHDPTLEFRAKISYMQTENGNDQFTLKTEDGTWISTGASADYASQELSDFEDGTHQYLSLIFRIPDDVTPVALRNGGYLWSFHTEEQVIHSLEGQSMQLDHTMRRTWDLPERIFGGITDFNTYIRTKAAFNIVTEALSIREDFIIDTGAADLYGFGAASSQAITWGFDGLSATTPDSEVWSVSADGDFWNITNTQSTTRLLECGTSGYPYYHASEEKSWTTLAVTDFPLTNHNLHIVDDGGGYFQMYIVIDDAAGHPMKRYLRYIEKAYSAQHLYGYIDLIDEVALVRDPEYKDATLFKIENNVAVATPI